MRFYGVDASLLYMNFFAGLPYLASVSCCCLNGASGAFAKVSLPVGPSHAPIK